jgi:hypothetical protein
LLVLKLMRKKLLVPSILFLAVAGCAPELTEPAKTSLAGTWQSTARLFGYSNIRLTMVQEPQGVVSGRWTATGIEPANQCSIGMTCNGNLIGRNLVAHVNIDLLNIGSFEGNLVEPQKLRGVFAVSTAYDTITFVRTGN